MHAIRHATYRLIVSFPPHNFLYGQWLKIVYFESHWITLVSWLTCVPFLPQLHSRTMFSCILEGTSYIQQFSIAFTKVTEWSRAHRMALRRGCHFYSSLNVVVRYSACCYRRLYPGIVAHESPDNSLERGCCPRALFHKSLNLKHFGVKLLI